MKVSCAITSNAPGGASTPVHAENHLMAANPAVTVC
jgi:hypothetical protein